MLPPRGLFRVGDQARNVMIHLQKQFTKRYPVTNHFVELKQFMAKLVTYSIMKWKRKDEIMSLVQRVRLRRRHFVAPNFTKKKTKKKTQKIH